MPFFTSSWIVDVVSILVVSSYLLYKFFTRNFDYWAKRGVPFIKPIPLFGNFLSAAIYKEDIGKCLSELYASTKGPYIGIWVFNTPHFLVRSPELVKAVLVKDFNYFSDRTILSDEKADSIASNFLFVKKNPEWKDVRSKMTPVFTSGKLKSMFDLIIKASEELKCYLDTTVVKKPFEECKEICAKFTTDVLTSTAFGINSHCFENPNSEFRDVGRKMFTFNLRRAFNMTCYFFIPSLVSLFKMKFFDESIYKFLRHVFWETINERERNNYKRNDLIDIIVEMKKKKEIEGDFSGDRIVAQAVQFYAAGFETTSSTMSFALYELCLQPQLQEKLRMEIKDTLQENGGLNYECIQNMKYLHMVVSETLRKYPVLPFLDRRCIKDYAVPGTDLILEKGTPVYIPMIGLHKDPDYFPDPEAFNPERFNEENVKKIPPYVYIPFGEGPHNCIGARFGLLVVKVGLIQILSEFEVEKSKETPIPISYDPKSFVMQSKIGLPMKFKKVISVAA